MTQQIERLGVVGAGQMGRGIAQVAAAHGLAVRWLDVTRAHAERGKDRLAEELARLVGKGKLDEATRQAWLDRVLVVGDPEELARAGADFVIEAASESLPVKQQIFADLDRACRPDVILASNTSSISITALAACTRRPDQVIGMHFMNPVPLMQLCELIRGLPTSEATWQTTRALAERLGKVPVTARDAPGFIVNRVLMPLCNEACFALQEGVASAEDIDRAIVLGLNHPMGPLRLMDLIGLDTTLAILEVLHRDLGEDKYRPCPLLRQYVAAGWLGRKTGRGFHVYA